MFLKADAKRVGALTILSNESGIITLDFIFAITLAFGFSIIFFAMSFTLSMVEVAQYITFSSARSYHSANVTEEAQKDLGKQKYDQLKNVGIFKTILKTGWITMGEIELGNFSGEYQDDLAGPNAIFVGAKVPFRSTVLNLRLPFLGDTAHDSSTGSATLNAYLMREVSTEECREKFTRHRLEMLKVLDTRYNSVPTQGSEALITDNGC